MANDILLYENPYYGSSSSVSNPHRRKHHRRNPNIMSGVKSVTNTMFGGLEVEQVLGAVAGFALAAFVPGKILKFPTGTTTDTTLMKAGRVGIALGLGIVAKVALNKVKGGKMANSIMYGSIAGAAALAYKQWAPSTWPVPLSRIGAPSAAPMPRYSAPAPSNNLGGQTASDFIPANQL